MSIQYISISEHGPMSYTVLNVDSRAVYLDSDDGV